VTAAFIKIIMQIFYDLGSFGATYILAVVAFANTYFIMAYQFYSPLDIGYTKYDVLTNTTITVPDTNTYMFNS